MSKITNDGLTRSDTRCFIAVPIWQRCTVGVKDLKAIVSDHYSNNGVAGVARRYNGAVSQHRASRPWPCWVERQGSQVDHVDKCSEWWRWPSTRWHVATPAVTQSNAQGII